MKESTNKDLENEKKKEEDSSESEASDAEMRDEAIDSMQYRKQFDIEEFERKVSEDNAILV
jgi:hypothetical protein